MATYFEELNMLERYVKTLRKSDAERDVAELDMYGSIIAAFNRRLEISYGPRSEDHPLELKYCGTYLLDAVLSNTGQKHKAIKILEELEDIIFEALRRVPEQRAGERKPVYQKQWQAVAKPGSSRLELKPSRLEPRRFLSLLSRVLSDEAQRCLANGSRQEPDLRGVLELVMRNERTMVQNASPPVILLPDDAPVQVQDYSPSDKLLTLDLKTVTLLGMWRGEHPNDDERMPTVQELQELHAGLRDLDDDAILERQYRVWSPTLRAMEIVRVGDLLESEPQHAQFLAVGGDRVLVRPQLAVWQEEEAEEEEEDGGFPELDSAADLMEEEDADQWTEEEEERKISMPGRDLYTGQCTLFPADFDL
ncbi:hypothetical protein GGX14DRAFT_396691 [Mycena pura]|uniref:Uncharacterized protein n=1 Tax=Mycena pura TaxID=153505 RepID=A0AAD6VDJ1_9AGAR|nr:hypothetical protein GGX14DRAFT_396691 [Mycena pura]